ncbi:RagB/SusD family nutrient uptake outer membrane protein [Chitinophaga cymbidii]|uniref:Membrane protein n=1 Tax=Chitinophaga cymbidii TaxID=1096750 RepID=A0A512RTC4_9BACT|nr:RagB/SusD family nutrient uptake outer membrane protein [Chitinophaga cymbidii]GEP98937.1 membrane protein [Chitinophaga cymbidii]
MKKLRLLYIAAIFSLVSCEDFLETPPLTNLSGDSFYKSPSDAQYAVNALYTSFYELEGSAVPYMDILTDLIFLKNSWEAGFFPATNGSLTGDNWWIGQFWSSRYTKIRNANYFFENIDKFQGQMPEAEMNNYKGQVRAIRAFLYTRLMQGFGDVPLITTVLPVEAWPARNKAEEVIGFIMKEFDQAIIELPTEPADAKHGRLTKYAAYVLKARAALYVAGYYNKPEYYEVAADALREVVTSGRFSLFRRYNDPYRDFGALFLEENEGSNNPEIILSYQFTKDLAPNNMTTAFAGPGWKSFQAHQNYIDMFEGIEGWQKYGISFAEMNKYRDTKLKRSPLEGVDPNYDPQHEFANRDPRLGQTFFDPHISQSGGVIVKPGEFWAPANRNFAPDADNDAYFFKKMVEPSNFNPVYYYGNSANNYILIRYADVELLYAEALNETNHTGDAIPYVNDVRSRAGMPPITAGSKEELREIIKHERKIELIMEQQLYWDYKRWRDLEVTMPFDAVFYGYRREVFGQESQVMETKKLEYPKYYTWPIPVGELQNNGNLVPNTDW